MSTFRQIVQQNVHTLTFDRLQYYSSKWGVLRQTAEFTAKITSKALFWALLAKLSNKLCTSSLLTGYNIFPQNKAFWDKQQNLQLKNLENAALSTFRQIVQQIVETLTFDRLQHFSSK